MAVTEIVAAVRSFIAVRDVLGREHAKFREHSLGISMRAPTVRMTIEWRLPGDQARSVSDALHALSTSAPRAGLLRCWFPRGSSDPVVLRYTSHWPSEARLREHIAAGQLVQVAELVERAGAQASMVFEKSGNVHGIEYIDTLLRDGGARSSARVPRVLSAHGRWRQRTQ